MLRYLGGWLAIFSNFFENENVWHLFKKTDVLLIPFGWKWILSTGWNECGLYNLRNLCLWSRYNKECPMIFPLILADSDIAQ